MSEFNRRKTYLGDGVYAQHNQADQIILTTEYGDGHPTNKIALEFSVFNALISYAPRVWPGELEPLNPPGPKMAAE